MSARDGVGHPDCNPKGSRSNLNSQHKGPGGLPGWSATGRESWNCPQQENLRDCRTQVLLPRPLGPAKLSIKRSRRAQRETDRQRERERKPQKRTPRRLRTHTRAPKFPMHEFEHILYMESLWEKAVGSGRLPERLNGDS